MYIVTISLLKLHLIVMKLLVIIDEKNVTLIQDQNYI
jgi:hypothetical protein